MSPPRNDLWATEWVVDKLEAQPEVASASPSGECRLEVSRTRGRSDAVVAVVSVDRLDLAEVNAIVALVPDPDFIVNICKDSYISESGMSRATDLNIGIGTLGELQAGLRNHDVRVFSHGTAAFVLKSVQQHSNIISVERIADNLYTAVKANGTRLRFATIHDYDLGADSVRTALSRYSPVDALVSSNPNARISLFAKGAAASAGVRLLDDWRSFLGFLK